MAHGKSKRAKGASGKRKQGRRKTAWSKAAAKAVAATGAGSGGPCRARSAYIFFCVVRRKEICSQTGGGPGQFSEAAKALSQAWGTLTEQEKLPYKELAELDRHRVGLARLIPIAKADNDADKIVVAVEDVLLALARASSLVRSMVVPDTVTVLEELERKMSKKVREATGKAICNVVASSGTISQLQSSLGGDLGRRIVDVCKRCQGISMRAQLCKRPPATPTLAPARPAASSASENETRKKVVGLLMKTFARQGGRADFPRAKAVEAALFAISDARSYKARARSLVFNLGASDKSLYLRVQSGEVSPEHLAKMESEGLASDAMKAERKEQRVQSIQEVKLLSGPAKRRWEVNRVQEKFAAPEEAMETADEAATSSKPAAPVPQCTDTDDINIGEVTDTSSSASQSSRDESSESESESV